jgi:hypothetical protein
MALKPAEVDIIVAARARGVLSLSLRGVNDHDVVARREPRPATDSEHEKRLKLEQSKRAQLERELQQLKEDLAKKLVALAPAPKPTRAVRIATIYRGIHNAQRIRTDQAAVAELEPSDPPPFPEGTASQAQVGSSTAPTIAAGNQSFP